MSLKQSVPLAHVLAGFAGDPVQLVFGEALFFCNSS
jgi:hypothetical protein